ncbi:hypothetical protein Tco_0330828 [Tanacetum coccineum]
MSMDDPLQQPQGYEHKLNGCLSQFQVTTDTLLMCSSSNNNTSSTNEAVNTAMEVLLANTQVYAANFKNIDTELMLLFLHSLASQPNSPQHYIRTCNKLHPKDMEDMDLRWQMLCDYEGPKVFEEYMKEAYFYGKETIGCVFVEISTSTALVSCDSLVGYDWSDQAEEGLIIATMAFSYYKFLTQSTYTVNAAGINGLMLLCGITSIKLPFDQNMHALEDYNIFNFSRNVEDDGVEADMNNLDTTIQIGLLRYTQAEGIDYNEVFAPIARIEAIRYQVNPKVSHLHAVKRIFRYLKGQPKLGLWYLKDSPFDLVAYTDSDYAGASLDRKSTTGCCQFLRCRLISWQCKKQTMVANSTTEAEYVAASSYQQLDGLPNHKRIYIAPSHIKKIFGNMRRVGKGFLVELTSLFQQCVMVQNQSELGERSVNPTDSHHTPTVIQSSTQPQKTQKPKKPKRKDTQVPQPSDPSDNVADEAVHKELGDSLVRAATTASSLEAEQDSGNITKTRSKATPNESSSYELLQVVVQVPRNHEGYILLKLRVLDLEKTKTTQQNEIASLKRRVKKLEKKNRFQDGQSNLRIIQRWFDTMKLLVMFQDDADKEKFEVDALNGRGCDKGKGIMIEEPVKPIKKKVQIMIDEEVALKLQAEFIKKKDL